MRSPPSGSAVQMGACRARQPCAKLRVARQAWTRTGHDRRPQPGAAVFRADLHRLCLRQAQADPRYRAGLDEFLHPLCGAAGPVLPHPRADPARTSSTRSRFIVGTTLRDLHVSSRCRSRSAGPSGGHIAGGDHRGAGRRLRQYRLHGAGPGAGDARAGGGGAGGADLLLRHAAAVHARAVPDGAGRGRAEGFSRDRAPRGQADRAPSLHHRDRARRGLGRGAFRAAGRARPADAVPAERGGALRAVHARRDGGAAADRRRCRGKCRC